MNPSVYGRKVLLSILSFSIAMQSQLAYAAYDSKDVVNDVSSQLRKIAGAKASFCFAVENGAVTGYNENDPVRTASVTKTLTTFWAVERLGPNFQYTTKIYVQPSNHEVHIEGQRDPFFDRDRLFTLMADLNRKGVKDISRLTFDSNFWYWPNATELRYMQGGGGGGSVWSRLKGHGGKRSTPVKPLKLTGKTRGGHARGKVPAKAPAKAKGRAASKPHGRRRHAFNTPNMTSTPSRMPASIGRAPAGYTFANKQFKHFIEAESHTDKTLAGDPSNFMAQLKTTLNTAKWDAGLKTRYQKARSANAVLQLPENVQMKTDVVDLVPSNPLAGKPGVIVFTMKSAPMHQYLKLMNIWSINPWAEEIFFSLGGKYKFQQFMEQYFKFGDAVKNVNTGSGVNMHGNARNDSTVTCSSVVRMIRRLDMDLENKWHMDLSDVLSVPGHDGGTWVDSTKTLVVKTGTLNNPTPAKNLAGVEETTSGEVYFGIFVDRRGGNKNTVGKALHAMQSNFHGVPVKESLYTFNPFGGYTHMAVLGRAIDLAKK